MRPLSRLVEEGNAETSSAAGLMRSQPMRLSSWRLAVRLTARPVGRFGILYLWQGAWRGGLEGLVVSALSAWFEFLRWAKWWERGLQRTPPSAAAACAEAGGTDTVQTNAARAASRDPKLSVVVLTKNEEDKIARCLQSVSWADEVIVVDGESEDRTPEICRSLGATVVSHSFDGSFATDRNLGMERARGDWVLQIDADDIVTPEFRQAVRALLHEAPQHDAFKFRRRSVLLGRVMRHGGWHYSVPNLVRRGRVRYAGSVHERPTVPGTIGELTADVEHHPCEDLAVFLERHNRYTALQVAGLFDTYGVLTRRQLARAIWNRPWKTFWKSYVKKGGWREGFHGLVFAEFFAGVELLKWAKYWEAWQCRPRSQSSS